MEIRRADIGILAGEAGHLFYRGKHYAISLDDLSELKLKGVIILIIEKRGIAELLRYIAAPYGIALLSTQGFLTENAVDLAYLAEKYWGKSCYSDRLRYFRDCDSTPSTRGLQNWYR